jgi:phospholipid/cholesterol/gamma-HCH transport system substrate-binding protein
MPKRISPFQVGLFFLFGAAVALGGLLWVGATHFYQPGKTYVTFFKTAVLGLNPGASVRFLGIQVGRVTAVGLAPNGKLVRVEMKLDPKFNVKGMAVDLSQQGIMGQVFLGISPAPPNIKEITPKIDFPTKYPVIASHPGEISRIETSLEKIVQEMESLDLKGLVADLKRTTQKAEALLSDKDIRQTIRNLKEITGDIHNLSRVLGKPGTTQKWQKSFDDLAATVVAARSSTEALAKRLQSLPPEALPELTQQLQQTLMQTNQVLTSLQGLVHEFRQEPGKVLVIPKSKEPFRR